VGAVVEFDQRRLLVVGFDMQCCGDGPDSWQEGRRRIEAALVRSAIDAVLAALSVDAVLLGGDINAVNGPRPLEILRGDGSGMPLAEVHITHRHSDETWTWDGRGTPFPNGRLDYVLHSGALLPLQAQIFDSEGLSADESAALGLPAALSRSLSDHRPLVVDFGWRLRGIAEDFDHGHGEWTALLERHVHWQPGGHASVVDYAGFASDRAALGRYLQRLSSVTRAEYDGWSEDKRHAFLINAYNAFTVELILTRYPDLKSIRELGSLLRSPWRQRFFDLLGEKRSLDDVEHGLLRGAPDFAEPRIHFAVNCASIGCPALRPEAFRHDALEAQYADQTRRFLTDRTRNRVRSGRLEVSRLFDWYAGDFKADEFALRPPLGFLARHADLLSEDPEERQRIRRGEMRIRFTDYDWALNRSTSH
jgi:hypothetical protein